MVGIFSRLGSRRGHRRTKSATETREPLPLPCRMDSTGSSPAAPICGIEIAFDFKPVKHPVEPPQHDQPVTCPLAEPFISNDGSLWCKQLSSMHSGVKTDLTSPKAGLHSDSEAGAVETSAFLPTQAMLPSFDPPKSEVLCLLEEFNAVEDLPHSS